MVPRSAFLAVRVERRTPPNSELVLKGTTTTSLSPVRDILSHPSLSFPPHRSELQAFMLLSPDPTKL